MVVLSIGTFDECVEASGWFGFWETTILNFKKNSRKHYFNHVRNTDKLYMSDKHE